MAIEVKSLAKTNDLELARASVSPVLGKDRLRDVIGYNLAKLLFVDLLSKGFIWVCMATWVGLRVVESGKASDTVLYGYGAHVILAFFYWAARGQFAEVVTALCDWLKGVRVGPSEAGK
jgi:hypothetical protein